MSTDPQSTNPLLSKMDALMKKHRGPGEATPEAAPEGWLPVLTDVIHRGTPMVTQTIAAPVAVVAATVAPVAAAPAVPAPPVVELAPPPSLGVTDTLAEQLLSELGPKLSEVMEKQVAFELRKNLDETVAALMSQLDMNVREIVRDAVNEKLKPPKPGS